MRNKHNDPMELAILKRAILFSVFFLSAAFFVFSYSPTVAWAAAPPAPTSLTATAASSYQINLSWKDNATTETNYSVERSPNGSSSWTVIATLGANITSYQNTGLTQNTTYYYRVRCKAGSTYSSYSNTANAKTATLAAPTALSATVASASQINLSWTDNTTYETNYSVERSPNGSSSWTVIATLGANVTTYTNTGLAVGTAYYYRVRAYDGANYSAYSSVVNQTIRTIAASAGANGAISPSGTVAVANGSSKAFAMTPNTGYKIASVTVDGGAVATNPTYTFSNITANHTIAATFSASTYTITASAGANGSISPAGAYSVSSGGTATFTITPAANYHVADVVVDSISKGVISSFTFTNVTANHTIAAGFAINTFTVTPSVTGGNGSINPSTQQIVSYGSNTAFTMTPNSGSYLSNLSVDGSSVATASTYTFTNVSANHTIAATFSAVTYTITASAGANGSISPTGAYSVSSGGTATFTITPAANYHVADVVVDSISKGVISSFTFTNVTANHTIAAGFAINTFTVTPSVTGGNGNINPSTQQIVSYGSSTAFTMTPNTGYYLSNLSVDGSSVATASTYTFTNVTANHTIAAAFSAITYTITASAGANGTISPVGAVSVVSGATQTFIMTPNAGYNLSNLSVDGSTVATAGTYTFTNVSANHTIAATFSAITYTITASAGANGTISPIGAVSVSAGATQTFTMTPNSGSYLSNLSVDGSSVATASTYMFTNVTANHTINAIFTSNSTTIDGGIISTDTTWTLAGSPYIVMGTVSVYGTPTTPVTLTIDPGVVVKFDSGAGLQIGSSTNQGALDARGTANNRITFTRSGTSGTWAGITFNDGTEDNVTILENADVQYTTGIVMNSASPKIISSSVTNVTGWGMYLTSSNPVLDNVTISNSGGVYGIYLSSSSPTITGGSLTNSTPAGSGIVGSGSPVISNYTISVVNTAGNYGVYLSSGSTSTLSITNSTIGNGLYLGTTGITPTITGNTFTNYDNSPLRAGAMIVSLILDNNTFTGMTSASRIEVLGEQVTQDTHWEKWLVPYVVLSGTIAVYKDTTTPVTLTIDPGVLVKFTSGAIQIGYNTNLGALVARGTAADHITFTRNGTSGNWSTITFNNGTIDGTTVLEYVDIQYNSGIVMNSTSPTISNSTITDVTNGYYGLSLTFSNPTIDTVTITSNGYGIYLNSSSPIITGGSLTSSNSVPGAIFGSGSPVISNYSISSVNSAGAYGVNISTTTSSLSLTNSTISNGLFIGSTNIIPTIAGNTFTNTDNSSLHAGANIIAQILDNNTFADLTSAGKIEVSGELINRDTRWKQWAAPYVVSGWVSVYKDAANASSLTIDPGVTLKFDQGGMQIGNSTTKGVLIAKGTAAKKILFTSSQTTPTVVYWGGITFSGDAASSSTLENATIEYAGSGGAYSSANIILNSSSPVIRNSIIRNGAQSGIYASSAQSWPVIIDSEITGNKWGIYSFYSNPYITNTKIYSNTTAGVWNASTYPDVDARDNWWGVATGPTCTSNPNGTGDKINDHVLYNPWLGQVPGSTLSITGAKVLPASMNPDGDYVTFTATISSSATWTITLTDGNSALVKNFSGIGTSINQKWYGENSLSTKVTDSVYYYKIDAMDTGGNTASSPQGLVLVSRQIPIAIMDPPYDNQMFQCGGAINITGTAADSTDFKNYSLDYGEGENPSSWTNLTTSTTSITNGLLYAWNTSSLTGYTYTVRLTVNNNTGNVATETSRVRFLCIQNAAVSEGYISPNGDGVKDSTVISATFTQPSDWTVTIKNSTATVVRIFSDVATSVTQTWDGKNNSGEVQPDGTYTYQIDAIGTGTTTTAAPKTGSIVVDTVSPVAQITAPVTNAVLWSAVQIIGTVTDANFGNYQLDYGPTSGAGPWNFISSAITSISSGTLTTWVTNDAANSVLVPNGSYFLRLVVTDKAGNSTISTVPVSVNNLMLSSISASSHTLDTYQGETSTLSYSINSAATVTLKIVPEKQGPTGTPVYQASQAIAVAESSSFTWDGKDNTGKTVPDEAYLIIIVASDGIKTDTYSPATPTGTGSINCTPDNYDPYINDPMTVSYVTASPSRVNLNIAWGLQSFRVLDAFAATTGSHIYNWDGRNAAGMILDAGAQVSCSVASLLPENHIITSGDTVGITAFEADPYSMHLSYGQYVRLRYTLSRTASVTVTLVSPTGAITVVKSSEQQNAGSQEVIWNGISEGVGNEKQLLINEEGDYQVQVRAVNPVTGTISHARGALRIRF